MTSAHSVVSGSISVTIGGSAASSAPVSNPSLGSPTKVFVPSTIPSQPAQSATAAKPTASSATLSGSSQSMSSASTRQTGAKPTNEMPTESTGKDVVTNATTTGTPKATGSPTSTSTKPSPTSTHTSNSTSSASKPNQATGQGPPATTNPAPPPPTSTKVTVSVVHVEPSTTRTSTITDAPISTFSTPVAISVTESSNGKVLLSTPPAVTVLSTSTAGDGEFVTYTHVVANPTNYRSEVTSSGFLSNHGAVAGVFVSVGVVVVTVSVFLAICIRQRRRMDRRRRWLEGMQPQYVPDPFDDPTETRQVRSLDSLGPLHGFNDSRMDLSRPPTRASQRPSVIRKPVPDYMQEDRDTFDPDRLGYMNVQRAVNRDSVLMSRASIAPSSPSIYPASLPDVDEDNSDGQEATTGHNSDSQQSTHYLVSPPPRPPRSHLRMSSVRPGQIYPTPATSFTTSSTPDQPSSPESENGHTKAGKHPILARRTLLGVQPRASPPAELDQ